MDFSSVVGQGRTSFLLFAGCGGSTRLESEAVVSGFKDVTAVGQAVVILASPKTVAHSAKLRLVVMTTLVRS